jgi:hypothetical protein
MTEGLPYDQQVETLNNPYLNMEQKGFKRTTNLAEAAQDVPSIFQTAMQKSGGNPEVLKSLLEAAKQNSYQTMPSPTGMPLQFARYYQSLVKNYGPEVAAARMQDYMKHEMLNQVKGQMIPSL